MASVPPSAVGPTTLTPLPRLLAYAQGLGLERHLFRPKRDIPTVALALLWLMLAWRGTGRPHRLGLLGEPLLAALLGRSRLPCAQTLHGRLTRFSAYDVRAAVEAAYRAKLPRRTGQVWAAVDAHQLPYWGCGKLGRFAKGWSGNHSRRLLGYRLYLAVDADTGQVITSVLTRGDARDADPLAAFGRRLAGLVADCGFASHAAVAAQVPFIRGFARSAPIRARLAALSGQQRRWLRDGGAIRPGACPWVYVISLRSKGPDAPATTYRRRWRWRVEQAIESCSTGPTSTTWSATRGIRIGSPSASGCSPATSPSASRSPRPTPAPPRSVSRPPSAPPTSTAWAPSSRIGTQSC